jgi:hypothetical protein
MNPLVALKEKLMIKPRIEESRRVMVVIKGNAEGVEGTKDVEGVQGETIPLVEIKEKRDFDRMGLLKKLAENKKLKVI